MNISPKEFLSSLGADIIFLYPEIFLSLIILLYTILYLFLDRKSPVFEFLFLAITIGFSGYFFSTSMNQVLKTIAAGTFEISPINSFWKALLALTLALGIPLFKAEKSHSNEKYPLQYLFMLTMLLAGFITISARHWLLFFVGLETISICSYLIINFYFTAKAHESALKYILFGILASCLMLWGISYIYGANGHLYILKENNCNTLFCRLGYLFCLSGLLFKVTAFPFHIWFADVLEGASYAVGALLSIFTKIIGFALLYNLLSSFSGVLAQDTRLILAILGIITLVIGNFSAIKEQNTKRFLAYSGIAQTGLLIAFLACSTPSNLGAFIFYLIIYTFSVWGMFYFFQRHENKESTLLSSIGLLLSMVSLAGLPPLAGFLAKIQVLLGIWAYEATPVYVFKTLLVIVLISTLVSFYYYLRLPISYIKNNLSLPSISKENKDFLAPTQNDIYFKLSSLIFILPILLLFLVPNLINDYISQIITTIP